MSSWEEYGAEVVEIKTLELFCYLDDKGRTAITLNQAVVAKEDFDYLTEKFR